MTPFSLIIVTWNCRQEIEDCLISLDSLGLSGFETIIVDACSTDGTADYLRSLSTSELAERIGLRYFPQPERKSYSFNNEIGLSLARSQLVCFSNPDIVFTEDFKRLLDESQKRDNFFFAGCQLVSPNGSLQYAGRNLTPKIIVFNFTYVGRILDRYVAKRYFGRSYLYEKVPLTNRPIRVEHLIASLWFTNKTTMQFLLTGRFARRGFTWFCSDSDMFRLAQEYGVPVLFFSDLRVIHGRSYSLKRASPILPQFEMAYGTSLYLRYWNLSARLTALGWFIDAILKPMLLMLRRRDLRGEIRSSASRLQGIIRAFGVRLQSESSCGITEAASSLG